MTRYLLAALIVLLSLFGLWAKPTPTWQFEEPPRAELGTGTYFKTVFSYTSSEGAAHAPAITSDPSAAGLIWFDGLREGHNDVKILVASPAEDDTEILLSRQSVSAQFVPPQTILTLGNTISDIRADSYFATVVTLGGWAAASIAHIAEGQARKLNLSPIIARSHLVRSPVVPMRGNQLLLPAYFELEQGYGVAALLDENRRVVGQSNMRSGYSGIQPTIVPLSERKALALLRRFDRENDRLLASWTEDGGRNWSPASPLNLPNPNAPVAAVSLDDGRLLMLFNDSPDSAEVLRFAMSDDDGKSWKRGRILDGPDNGQLRYPVMQVLDNGRILATYSIDKTKIVAHEFSADWAMQL